MAIMLPSELETLLAAIGCDWPQSNEDALMESGEAWMELGQELSELAVEAGDNAAGAWTEQVGKDIEAFKTWWESEDGPPEIFGEGAKGAMVAGAGLMICSVIVLCLKIMILVQLAILAFQIALAIAQAAVTFGASLAQIPIFRQVTKTIVDTLVDQALNQLLGV